jgi:hypothetical protein
MSYPLVLQSTRNLENLLFRKEFAQLKLPVVKQTKKTDQNPLYLEPLINKDGHLFLHPHQQFVRNFMGPNNTAKRILCKHTTGSGKTNTALSLAFEYIKYYKQEFQFSASSGGQTPLVFVIGFSKQIFQRELLRQPQFGFITREEMSEHRRLRHLAEIGAQQDKDTLTEFEIRIRKRLTRKNWGGFFKFIGYKEFFNRLFIFSTEAFKSAKVISVAPGEDETPAVQSAYVVGDEEFIMAGLKAGTITINWELVIAFANSVVICDEVQNNYNSIDINNYGVALRVLFNLYDIPTSMAQIFTIPDKQIDILRNASIWVLLLTATPIGTNPTEIVDLLNLLVPASELQNQAKLRKEDFFIDNRNLKPGALEKIQKLIIGHVSFLYNINPKYYPERIIEGEEIAIPPKYMSQRVVQYKGDVLPYLKFIRCPMSEFHYNTYKQVYTGTLPPDGQSLTDMVIDNPGNIEGSLEITTQSFRSEQVLETNDTTISEYIEALDAGIFDLETETAVTVGGSSTTVGLYRTKDIRYALTNASQAWKDKHKIDFVKQEGENYFIITGDFMRMPTLAKYSTKYAKMVEYVQENLEKHNGKIQISHQTVRMSGVLFIQEVLLRNGILDEYANPTPDTLCVKCGIRQRSHSRQDHAFVPARFIIAHGDIDRATMERSLEKYRLPENVEGDLYRILVGSKLLNEAYDLNAVRQVWVMSVPANISALLQIFGRSIRTGSHLMLPPEKRNVRIGLFIHSLPTAALRRIDLTYEERKYFEKLQDYIVIQILDRVLNASAIDAITNRDTIFPPSASKHRAELGLLYFEPADVFGKHLIDIANNERAFTRENINLTTFYPFHADEEVRTILYVIKRLLIEQSSVWTYTDLWEAVRQPPFDVYINPALFTEADFLIALGILLSKPQEIDKSVFLSARPDASISAGRNRYSRSYMGRLFDPDDTYILKDQQECRLIQRSKYYILLPIHAADVAAIEDYSSTALGSSTTALKGAPQIDVDSWYRHDALPSASVLHITNYLRTSNISYYQMKYKFYQQFKDIPINQMPTTVELYDLDFHVHLVEDAIRYVFNIYTNADIPFSELHTFYFKMLYFYDRLEMILFADQIEDSKYFEYYKPYITHANIKYGLHTGDNKTRKILEEDYKYNPFLFTSIYYSETEDEPQPFNIGRLNEFLGKRSESHIAHAKLADMNLNTAIDHYQLAKNAKITKVFSNLLPVGHFLTTNLESTSFQSTVMPKLYIPTSEGGPAQKLWLRATDFMTSVLQIHEKENDILIGYYEKNPFGIDVKFKLRPPMHKIAQYEDSRLIERGSVCSTRHKDDLLIFAKQLQLADITKSSSIKEICMAIKLELMHLEMKERRRWHHLSAAARKTDIRTRYFYLHFEPQP